MSPARSALVLLSVALFPSIPAEAAGPASPFPKGYEQAYQAYLNSLPPTAKKFPWFTRLEGVAGPPHPMKVAGRPVIYLFACKPHACDTDQTNVFLSADKKRAPAVVKMGGSQTLVGGAGVVEAKCVEKLEASGGVATAC